MPEFLIGAYIALGSTIVGALISYFLSKSLVQQTHRNDLDLLRRDDFNKAAAIFRTAFTDQIFMLRQNILSANEMVHRIITPEVLILHDKAKIVFEPFLPSAELKGFNDAWLRYFNSNYQSQKVYSPGNVTDRKELSSIYLRNIESLFEFAKPKVYRTQNNSINTERD